MRNRTIFQFFHWYFKDDGSLWNHCREHAQFLADLGFSDIWLPPAYKSWRGIHEPGYAVYDHFDLGEFDQKGTVRTRWGTKQEYLDCIQELHRKGLKVIADIVLNHKAGGDEKEKVRVQAIDEEDRNKVISEPMEVEVHTLFNFPGRKGKYSQFVWDWRTFTGVAAENGEHEIYTILNEYGDKWDELIDDEKGNFDFLMGADIEFRNPHVRDELKWWGKWYIETTNVDGLRLDAVKHITPSFFIEWLDYLKHEFKKDFFVIAEYWSSNTDVLTRYIDALECRTQLFDVPLHWNFHDASRGGVDYDMRRIFDNTLTQQRPQCSITFVDNHDTQPLQSLESTVDYWFKPLANALILLRENGIPCIFYPSIYGTRYSDFQNDNEIHIELAAVPALDKMIVVRKELAYGFQRDYFDHGNTIGWTREGVPEIPFSGCAVLMTNGSMGYKRMEIGKQHTGQIFVDITGNRKEKIRINEKGIGKFLVNDRSVSVWINQKAAKKLKWPQIPQNGSE
jgi:alpha-amylase